MRQHYTDWVKYILNSRDKKELRKYVSFLRNYKYPHIIEKLSED